MLTACSVLRLPVTVQVPLAESCSSAVGKLSLPLAGDQCHAIRQQGRRVTRACCVKVTCDGPCPVCRVVKLRARSSVESSINSAGNQHLSVREQCRRVKLPRGVEIAGGRPGPAKRIVQFRGCEGNALLPLPAATSTFPPGNKVAVCSSRAVLRLPVNVQVPVAGSYNSALARLPLPKLPPATSTLPLASNVAVCRKRPVLRLPVDVQLPLAGSYSSALRRVSSRVNSSNNQDQPTRQ